MHRTKKFLIVDNLPSVFRVIQHAVCQRSRQDRHLPLTTTTEAAVKLTHVLHFMLQG